MDTRKHIDLLILLVKKLLQLTDLPFQQSHSLLERLCVASGKCSAAELVASLAFEANVGALRATWADAVTSYLLGATSVACLCDTSLAAGPDFDHFHRQNSRHVGGGLVMRRCQLVVLARGAVRGPTRGSLEERDTSRQHPDSRKMVNKTIEFVVVDSVVQAEMVSA